MFINGFGFNSGQLVVNGEKFTRKDFSNIVDFSQIPLKLLYPEIFAYTDQGVMNYVFVK